MCTWYQNQSIQNGIGAMDEHYESMNNMNFNFETLKFVRSCRTFCKIVPDLPNDM